MYNVLTLPYTYGRSGFPLVDAGRKYCEGLCPNAEKDLKEMIVVPINEKYTGQHAALTAEALKKVVGHYMVCQ